MTLSPDAERAIDALVARLSLEEKIGQMFQVDWRSLRSPMGGMLDAITPLAAQPLLSQVASDEPLRERTAPVMAAVTKGNLGSVLGGGGAHPSPNAPRAWLEQAAALQAAAARSASGMPLLIGNDSVHGQVNLFGATLFPHHIGQGCMRDADGQPHAALVERLAVVAARESYACGINWLFSPCLAVPRDVRWGRTYEGFGEEPALVGLLGAAEVRGLQQTSGVPVMACAKHWVADGGTALGTGTAEFGWSGAPPHVLDQGDCRVSECELRAVHEAVYLPSIAEGVLSMCMGMGMGMCMCMRPSTCRV